MAMKQIRVRPLGFSDTPLLIHFLLVSLLTSIV